MPDYTPSLDHRVFEDLRSRLVDRTRRNRLLHFRHTTRASMLRIVDEVPELVVDRLGEEGRFRFRPLPDPGDEPRDEQTPEFRAALTAARVIDEAYRAAIAELDPEDPSAPAKEARIDRDLRDAVRAQLGLPPRPHRRGLDLAAHALASGVEPAFDLAPTRDSLPPKHEDDWLQTLLLPDQLRSRLAALHKTARAVEQETGVGTLHLAVGFLEWFESDTSDQAFSSPLLLLPVGLERVRVRGGEDDFLLASLGEPASANLSLELRLRDDLRLGLPAFDPDARDGVEAYLGAVVEAVRPYRRWRVRRYLTLAPFSFARIAMYRDLDPANWAAVGSPTAHPLVRPLLRGSGGGEEEGGTAAFAEEHEVDRPEVERIAPVLVQDADSSQHSAIVDAMQGRNLVIEGPPGTGKSQTIANLIANAIHAGRTVLFVSEKMAALDVVKSRLDKVGLGAFCLTLHAAGAKPAAVVGALRARWEMAQPRQGGTATGELQARHARDLLREHLETVHAQAGPLGETVHALIGRLAEIGRTLPDLPRMLRPRAEDLPASFDAAAVLAARRRLEALELAAAVPGRPDWDPARSAWRALERPDLFPDEQAELLEALSELVRACGPLHEAGVELAARLGDTTEASVVSVQAMVDRVRALADPSPTVDRALLGRLTAPGTIDDARWLADRAEAAQQAAERLRAAGLADPAAAHPDRITAAHEAGATLGIAELRLDQVRAEARDAAERAERWEAQSRIAEALVDVLRLDADPEAGALLLACRAAELAAELDPLLFPFRRPGLERHASLVRGAAERQAEIEAGVRDVEPVLDLEGANAPGLRGAVAALRRTGLFAVMRKDVREARRLFRSRWRGGPSPERSGWAEHLEAAAVLLERRDAFRRDMALGLGATLRATLGGADPAGVPLRDLAAAAEWQVRVQQALDGERLEATHLRTALVALDEAGLHRLAGLAPAARALRSFLEAAGVGGARRWSAARRTETARAAALTEFARAVAAVDLPPSLRLAQLPEVAAAARAWQAAAADLASPRAQPLLAGSTAGPEALALRATAAFADGLLAAVPDTAVRLVADGWTAGVAELRASAAAASRAADRVGDLLGRAARTGLRSFAAFAENRPPAEVRAATEPLLAAADELSTYLRFALARSECLGDPLAGPVVRALEEGAAPLRHLPEGLEWLVAWAVVRRRAEANRAAFTRTGAELSTARRTFAAADRERRDAAAAAVAAAAMRRPMPRGSSAGSRKEWTDASLLENEFAKSRRHVPVRDLLGRAGDAVLALAPCLMMSPLTVAQYLRPGQLTFDLVVMDEASQIRPEDAVGALLRGRQAVVVGDPKQLPPTSFFDRALDEGEDEEAEDGEVLAAEDRVAAESVLDLAMRAFRPARRLRWHYRSRHEGLIAFSNREFYDDNLVVFPAAQEPSETLGVELVQVDGRWRERVNIEEAKAVARAVADLMHRHPGLSHGVVAMNQPQRELIEAEIDRLTAGDTDAAAYREEWEERLEPPFVKNLENVQGDERDVVFVSLGWGRTPQGAMHQRFFPVNRREDGHRRLNVLFTRAKRKVVLFASLRPEDIVVDPERTARGVRVLRDYLAYARDGRLERGAEGEEADSPFEVSVANALRARGHDVALQVGVAGYRIDLAARHPAMPARFVLGVECDGATYHSARSARDRDRLRQEALERLGWRLTRVWSTDWFRDPKGQADRLAAEIAEAIRAAEIDSAARARLVEKASSAEPPTKPEESTGAPAPSAAAAQPPGQAAAGEGKGYLPGENARPSGAPAEDAREALRRFREEVIMRDLPGSEPGRCILREAMIDALLCAQLDDPGDFHAKIPESLRSRTDGRQMRYLEQICDVIAGHAAKTS